MERPPQLAPIWRPYAEAARALGSRLTNAALRPGRSSDRLDDLARRLQKELDRMMQQAFDSLPGGGELACAPGCDYCCRTLPVGVSPIEVFTVIRRLRRSRDPDPALEARLAALALESDPRSPDGAGDPSAEELPAHRRLQPCPLLADGLCLVYSSRPLACRGCMSADASLCAACDDDRLVPRSTAHQLAAAAMMRGVTDALDSLGLAGTPIELRSGLGLALREEDAEKRWLRGEDVFAGLAAL
jgi:Fe-S-cluster containining protein